MRIGCGFFTMPLDLIILIGIHTEKSMAKSVHFKMHGLTNSLGCVILSLAMVDFVLTVFSLLETRFPLVNL